MLVLGIESSCDETAAAVVDGRRRVLSTVVSSQVEIHAEYGGVVPEIASRAHLERMLPVVRQALNDAGVGFADLDGVAVSQRPGLIGSLLVGVATAKSIAWSIGTPLIGVDHIQAHLYAGLLDRDADLSTPALGLVVSGGHTAIYRVDGPTDMIRLGATIDDALGEAYDKAAAILDLPYPGGPEIDRLAASDDADETAFDLPVSRLGKDSLDFSFSGLKTAMLYAVRGVPRPANRGGGFPDDHPPMTPDRVRNAAASFQAAAVRAVLLKLERSLEVVGCARSIVAGGGVVSNSRLRSELSTFAARHQLELIIPEPRFCVDNAAMIAGLGAERLARGEFDDLEMTPLPTTAC
ncbi:MAG: tRNA (adenosine(37)-N6)-threonylcarbamoyltransferase complex transferase subunit TsaD [Phycisphaerae bacterium]|nr:tRNA (adenosine(37)-N6)-threonylcarbamoyltransferase complex transferase subunit TsaD [Phycisphaerae bacterium]